MWLTRYPRATKGPDDDGNDAILPNGNAAAPADESGISVIGNVVPLLGVSNFFSNFFGGLALAGGGPGFVGGDHVLGLCRRAGFTPMIVHEASEIFTILNLVRAGLGVSLVPSAARRMGVPGVRFHELGLPEAKWRIGIVLNRFSDQADLISNFVATMRAAVRSEKVSVISR